MREKKRVHKKLTYSDVLGKRIRLKRQEMNMSQGQLALLVGWSTPSAVAKVETGVNDINQDKLMQFAKALNVSPSWLVGDGEDIPFQSYSEEFQDKERFSAIESLKKQVAELTAAVEKLPQKDNAMELFLSTLLSDRPDILNAIRTFKVEKGNSSFAIGQFICNLDDTKLEFIKNSIVMSFEQAKTTGVPRATILLKGDK